MNWEDKPQVKKGSIGEAIVDDILLGKGIIPYSPITSGAHPFDRLCSSADKKNLYVAETKTKARRTYYPDTGIDYSKFHEYQFLQQKYNIEIYLYFVDEMLGTVYGGLLSHISEPCTIRNNGKVLEYPLKHGKQIYFPLALMEKAVEIDADTIAKLRQLSTRSYAYEETQSEMALPEFNG